MSLFREVARRWKALSEPFRGLWFASGVVIAIWLIGAFGTYFFERDYPSKIKTVGDALYWSVTTITTTGYGDLTPQSPGGRLFGGLLMVVGVCIIAVLTGSFVNFFDPTARGHETALKEQSGQQSSKAEGSANGDSSTTK